METNQISNLLLSYCDNCRICLQINQQMTSIKLLKELHGFNELLIFFNVEVMTDSRYPNKICIICVNQLRNIVLFKQKCESSFNYLKHILNDNGFQTLPIQTGNLFHDGKLIKTEDPEENDFYKNGNIAERCQEPADKNCQEAEDEIHHQATDEIYHETVNNIVKTEESDTASSPCNKYRSRSETCSSINNQIKSEGAMGEIKGISNLSSKKTTKNRFECQYCLKSFQNEDVLTSHARIHLGLKPFPCTECSRAYSKKERLVFHKKLYHSDNPPPRVTCQKCGVSVLHLAAHIKNKHSAHKFECQYCAKKFASKSGLRDHVNNFHENSGEAFKLLCTLCGKKFRQGYELNRHNKAKHSDERNYPCRYCDKKFKTSNVRYNHEKSHSNDRRFKCTYCSKAFTNKKILESHVLIHTGEKPFSCSICSKAFRQGATLRNHIKLVHGRALI